MNPREPVGHPGVMVSSTVRDLEAHRAAVSRTLLRFELQPLMMEYDSAHAEDVITSSLRNVKRAVAYIGIIGRRYGQTPRSPRNPEGLSITELEFREARGAGLPILIFLMSDDHPDTDPGPPEDEANFEKLQRFRRTVTQMTDDSPLERVYAEFDSLHAFEIEATHALAKLRSQIGTKPFWRRLVGHLGSRDHLAGMAGLVLVALPVTVTGLVPFGFGTVLMEAGGYSIGLILRKAYVKYAEQPRRLRDSVET